MSPEIKRDLQVIKARWSELTEWQKKKLFFRFRVSLAFEGARRLWTHITVQWIRLAIGTGNHEQTDQTPRHHTAQEMKFLLEQLPDAELRKLVLYLRWLKFRRWLQDLPRRWVSWQDSDER